MCKSLQGPLFIYGEEKSETTLIQAPGFIRGVINFEFPRRELTALINATQEKAL
jgi:hypothetical protein